MSKKFDEFKIALEKICIEHKVVFNVSGYDMIEVRDLDAGHKDDLAREIDMLEDFTNDNLDYSSPDYILK